MKIVIITAKIYPNTSPRATRATELAKQLAKMGHEVVLCAALDKIDYSELEKEYNLRILPLKTRFYLNRGKVSFVRKAFNKVLNTLLHRVMAFPEIELKHSVKKLLLKEKDIDYLITIAMPYPIHWGATTAKKVLKESFPKYWTSDCGDPYWGDPFNKHPFYFKWLEERWSTATDSIVVPIESAKKAYLPIAQSKISVIPQGFDFLDVKIKDGPTNNSCPTFAYSGYVYEGRRDPRTFLDYLSTINKQFKIIIYTPQKGFYEKYLEKLKGKIELRAYIPRTQLIYELSCMDFLVNLTNMSTVQSPSKLIDYYLTKRPIIDVSTPFNEHDLINDALNGVFHENKYSSIDVEQYNIVNVAKQFVELVK